MQIVIDIDAEIAQGIIEGNNDEPRNIVRSFQATIADAIKNGTPLPKGHGQLIDADRLVPDCQEDFVYYDYDEHNVFTAVGIAQIECADTILEADRSEGGEL